MSTKVPSTTLYSGQALQFGQDLRSPNGIAALAMQGDGNCVLYPTANPDSGHAKWHTNTARNGHSATVNDVGQFVILRSSGGVAYTSANAPGPKGTYKLVLQNDGNLVMYNAMDTPVWHTNTAEKFIN